MPLLGLALVASLPAAAENWAPGETIEQAAFADLTPDGLNAISALIPTLLPSSIAIPDISDEPVWCTSYGLYGAWVDIDVNSATITPSNGVLDVTANLLVSINDSTDPFDLSYELFCAGDTCDGRVDAFPVTIVTTMALEVVDDGSGGSALDATIGDIVVSYDLVNEDIHLDSCVVGTIEDVLDVVGLSMYDLILEQLDTLLADAVAEMGPTLEETIEEAFASATIQQELELNGAVVDLALQPSDVIITPAGVRVQMSGSMVSDAAACVAAYDPGGSAKTPTAPPDIGTVPSGIDSDFHVGLILSDDFTNQALYSLWRGGLLCYAVEPGGDIPLDTSILNLLTGNVFEALFPETQPLTLQTAPAAPPTTSFSGGHDIDVNLQDLGLELYTQLDGRDAKIVTVALEGVVGVDLGFDGGTGELAIEVDLDPAALTPTVAYNEFYPEANDAIVEGFAGAFGSIVDTVVGGLLEGLAFGLPSFSGMGLSDLEAGPLGGNADWLGAFTWIGPATYEAADGCGGEGCGGDSSGCEGGCNTSPGVIGLWPALALLLVLRRRG